MKIIILGSGISVPTKERGYAGIFLKIKNKNILLDSGAGTLKRLAQMRISYMDLDYIFYTHFHPDHCLDLVSILFAMRNPKPKRKKPLFIFGPKGLKRFYKGITSVYKGILEPKTYRLHLKELSQNRLNFKDFRVLSLPIIHMGRCLGFRIEDKVGGSVAYSGDTDYCKNLIRLAKDVDLFILECSLPDKMKAVGHLTPTECGLIAQEVNCKKLILTHFYPLFKNIEREITDRVKRFYKGKIILARDFYHGKN